jgi:MFS family permease
MPDSTKAQNEISYATTGEIKRPWFFSLSPVESSTLVATFAGWMLDGMDVMVFSFVVPSLISIWHITQGQAGLLGTSALLISSVGGWLAGLAADRFGRVRVFQVTIVWFAVFTFLSGFTNSFMHLLIVRGLQGLGFGGEWAVGSVLMGETIRSEHRGKAVGTVQGGWSIGWGMAALAYTILFSVLPAQLAWRAMFWIGILPAALVFYIRRNVKEPEIFQASREGQSSLGPAKFLDIFGSGVIKTTLFASLVSLGAQGGYYAINTWLPLYQKESKGLSVLNTGGYLMVVILGSLVGYLTSAYLTDKWGRKRTLIIFALSSFITVWLYTALPIGNSLMLILGFPLGFFPSGSFSPMGAFFSELFPTRLRGSGQGFSYNLGRGVGAMFPAFVGYIMIRISLGHAIEIFSMAAYLIMALSVLALPETRGQDLQD